MSYAGTSPPSSSPPTSNAMLARTAITTSNEGTKLMSADTLKVQPAVEDAFYEAAKIKSMVTDAVEDDVRTALKTIKEGCHVTEDVIGEARHTTK